MQRLYRICVLVAIIGILGARGTVVRAQQPASSLSTSRQILSGYLPAPELLPAGLSPRQAIGLGNPVVAGPARDPVETNKIVERSRLDGVITTFARIEAPTITLRLSLYGDAVGAQTDLVDPVELASMRQGSGAPLSVAAVPQLVDMGVAYSLRTASSETSGIGFISGRLEVLVTEAGPVGTVNQNDLMPLARVMATQARTPPPPATDDELAVVQRQITPESILHDAYGFLLGLYVTKLTPSNILGVAYDGAVAALDKTGASGLPPRPQITTQAAEEAWAQFLDAYRQLESHADTISLRDLAYAAAAEMYGHLNCHTTFYTPSLYVREIASLRGQPTAGTGLTLSRFPDNHFVVLRVLPNSPAEAAGILPGDEIAAVDQQKAADLGSGFSRALSGEAGESVLLTILRSGAEAPFDVFVVRGPVQRIVEEHHILPGGIGYIEFDGFSVGDTVVNRVRDALLDFEVSGGVNGWILDLRYNGGGSESTLSRIAGLFVPPGSALLTVSSQDGSSATVRSVGTPLPRQLPLVILTSGLTASAAEIFAESLRGLGRATVIGGKSAGCVNGGVVLGLLDGAGVFVSTQEVRSGPNRVALESVGVAPDRSVGYTRDDLVSGIDPRLDAAVAFLTTPSTPVAAPPQQPLAAPSLTPEVAPPPR